MEIPQVIRDLYKHASQIFAKTQRSPKIYYARDEAHYREIERAAKSMPVGNSIIRIDGDSENFSVFAMRITTTERERITTKEKVKV